MNNTVAEPTKNKGGKIKMKKIWKVLAISMVLAGVLVAVLAGTVLAQGPQGSANTCGAGRGTGSALDEVSQLTGLTPEQIQEQREAGKSLVQIAATKNVTEEALINAIMAEKKEAVQKLVTAGTITQEQADQRLAFMKERVKQAVNRTTIGPPEWAGGGKNGSGAGMRQGGQNFNQANCTGTGAGAGGMMRFGGVSR